MNKKSNNRFNLLSLKLHTELEIKLAINIENAASETEALVVAQLMFNDETIIDTTEQSSLFMHHSIQQCDTMTIDWTHAIKTDEQRFDVQGVLKLKTVLETNSLNDIQMNENPYVTIKTEEEEYQIDCIGFSVRF